MKIDIHQGDLGPMAYIIFGGPPIKIEEQLVSVKDWLSENLPNGGYRWYELQKCLLMLEEGRQAEKYVAHLNVPGAAIAVNLVELPFFLLFDTEEAAVLFKVWLDG
jgi:hypothetical protein